MSLSGKRKSTFNHPLDRFDWSHLSAKHLGLTLRTGGRHACVGRSLQSDVEKWTVKSEVNQEECFSSILNTTEGWWDGGAQVRSSRPKQTFSSTHVCVTNVWSFCLSDRTWKVKTQPHLMCQNYTKNVKSGCVYITTHIKHYSAETTVCISSFIVSFWRLCYHCRLWPSLCLQKPHAGVFPLL